MVERGVGAAKRVQPWRAALALRLEQRFLQPRFERLFIADSYANRAGKGTHRAVDRLQQFAQRYAYVLRADIVRHFPSIDHAILRATLARTILEDDVLALVDRILASGIGVLDDEYEMVYFPGDDLLAACRPRGLPIGNLSSQFWSNCYLHPFDQFVTRELRCPAYLRYVDDFALFSDSKRELWAWKRALVDRLAQLRLTIHAPEAQVLPTHCGIPWLGFVVYPTHRLLKAREVRATVSHLGERLDDYRAGRARSGSPPSRARCVCWASFLSPTYVLCPAWLPGRQCGWPPQPLPAGARTGCSPSMAAATQKRRAASSPGFGRPSGSHPPIFLRAGRFAPRKTPLRGVSECQCSRVDRDQRSSGQRFRMGETHTNRKPRSLPR
jgi:hypothetical protein